jgi:hypothetical protein
VVLHKIVAHVTFRNNFATSTPLVVANRINVCGDTAAITQTNQRTSEREMQVQRLLVATSIALRGSGGGCWLMPSCSCWYSASPHSCCSNSQGHGADDVEVCWSPVDRYDVSSPPASCSVREHHASPNALPLV